jgi:chromosome segregation ATPase
MPPDKERQMKALREMLDGIYLDAAQSHASGTVPCDLTIIFTALASLTTSYDDAKEDIGSIKGEIKEVRSDIKTMGNQFQDLATNIKVCDATSQAKKSILLWILGLMTGSFGLMVGRWVFNHWNDLMGLM